MRNQNKHYTRLLLISMLLLAAAAQAQSLTEDFQVLYPGVHTSRERPLVEKYFADNQALETRGAVDVQALIKGTLPKNTPGIGPTLVVTEAMVRYDNQKYDPDNAVLNVAEYARRLGYRDILAYPTFGAHDDSFMAPYPVEARDTLLVSQLNHSITWYRPVHPGDTLHLVFDKRTVTDRTPTEGSVYRSIVIRTEGSIYNQRGEKVNDVIFRVMESMKIYKDGKRPAQMGFAEMWEAPDWMRRKSHYYTDADWKLIRELWAKEKRRGAAPLYWEDVRVGEEPAWTVDGPIDETVWPTAPYGMGTGGSRSLRREIMDPQIFKTMIRGEQDGIYRLPDATAHVPRPPAEAKPGASPPASDGAIATVDIHKKGRSRAILVNFMGRDIAIRHINNWMGDHGWLENIRWGIMPPQASAAHGKPAPANPDAQRFLDKVPHLKGKDVSTHGMTGDLAIVKSYVYDKYFRDGAGFAELAWWIETIEGDIWLAGGATVKLPSQKSR